MAQYIIPLLVPLLTDIAEITIFITVAVMGINLFKAAFTKGRIEF